MHKAPQTGTHGTHPDSAHPAIQSELFFLAISVLATVVQRVQEVDELGAGAGGGVGVGAGGGVGGFGGGDRQLGSIG